MNLSKQTIEKIKAADLEVPVSTCFDLPEKVLQFGTGVLLRGLPDYFIDKANKRGIFNGRVVVVKSTSSGDSDAFDQQDGLYTQCIRGVKDGKKVEENIINGSISRVISAKNNWEKVLKCAANPDMEVIISNTTEVGITLDKKNNVHGSPPDSFPGKLLAFLYQRFKIFNGDPGKGMVIVPTELIPENGAKLEAIVLELSHQAGLEVAFVDWLESYNYFCNSLVDRIVPGKLPDARQKEIEGLLGYKDELMIMSEAYRLWAIESSHEKVMEILSFRQADPGVVITQDIKTFRELKLRLLNGSHTFSCGMAYLAGFNTVKEAMDNKDFSSYITNLMMLEIAPAITGKNLALESAKEFANDVLDRYRNPQLEHQWLSITFQYFSKMRLRNVPTLLKHYERFGYAPEHMALGFAAFLLFMKSEKAADGKYYGSLDGKKYLVNDDEAPYFSEKWKSGSSDIIKAILSDESKWEADFYNLPGFAASVAEKLGILLEKGSVVAMKNIQTAKMGVQT